MQTLPLAPDAPPADDRWRILVVHPDGRAEEGNDPAAMADPCGGDGPAVWLDVTHPSDAEVRWLQARFGLHPLAVEDVIHQHQRAKRDVYDGYQFLVMYAGLAPGGRDAGLNELNVFAGPRFLVTIHDNPIDEVQTARARWREGLDQSTADTPPSRAVEVGLYVLLDTIVDGYFPILDDIAEEISTIEDSIFARKTPKGVVRRLLRTRKRLLTLRRVLGGERDVVNALTRRELDLEGNGNSLYFLDVYDHLVRVVETLDVYHDLTASALDAHLSVTSFRLNETLKRMSAFATILATLMVITGVYGMNFEHMPELKWQYGYVWALGLMAVSAAGLFYWFRRSDWL